MTPVAMNPQSNPVLEFFLEYPESVRELAIELRILVRKTLADAHEELDRTGRVVGYSFGSGYSGLICTIIMSQAGVKLGIVGGAELSDPAHLLEGAGKRHRYVSFKTASDFQRRGIRDLIVAAKARWQANGQEKAHPRE